MRRRSASVLSVLVVVSLSLLATPSAARAATVDWVDQFGTPGWDFGYGVSLDGAGNSYVTGLVEGILPGQRNRGSVDAFLRAYDASGQELFTRQFGTRKYDGGVQTTTDATGVYVLGNTGGRFKGQDRAGGGDAFVRKYDLTGQHLWTLQFGTRREEFALNVEDHAGVLYVVGSTGGKFPGQTAHGEEDAFVAAISTDGDLQWVRQYGSRRFDEAYANAVDATGVYTIGYTLGRYPGQQRAGDQDVVVQRLDFNGDVVWTSQFGSPRFDQGLGIDLEAGDLYLGGGTRGRITTDDKAGQLDAWLRRVDKTDGAEVWTQQFGGRRWEGVSSVVADGAFLHAVGTTSSRLDGQDRIGEDDAFVRSSDLNGGNTTTTLFGTRRFDSSIWSDGNAGRIVAVGVTGGRFGAEKFGTADVFIASLSVP